MEMSEQQIKAMVIMNIIDNCTMELDNTGQERYSLNGQQFGKCVDTLVKNINITHCCMGEAEQFFLFYKELQKAGRLYNDSLSEDIMKRECDWFVKNK